MPGWAVPDPVLTTDHAAGEGVRVVVVDTGLDPESPDRHPWMAGVTGDDDPAIGAGVLGPYAGHGTFIAGVIRSVAPTGRGDRPVAPSAGPARSSSRTWSRPWTGCWPTTRPTSSACRPERGPSTRPVRSACKAFNETRLRHHKGVVLVAAAGNDASRQPFWPAAAPWTVSVGRAGRATGAPGPTSATSAAGSTSTPPARTSSTPSRAGTYSYHEPPRRGRDGNFDGMARWSGTSFSTPVVSGLIAARMSRTGENGRDAAAALLVQARTSVLPGVGAALLP